VRAVLSRSRGCGLLCPIPNSGVDEGEKRDGSSISTHDAGPERYGTGLRHSSEKLAFVGGETALRADNDSNWGTLVDPVKGGKGSGYIGGFIGKDYQAVLRPLAQRIGELNWLVDLRQAQHTALLGSFNHIGAHPFSVDAACHRALGPNGLKRRHPHLGRFLHHIVKARALQWCKQVVDVRAWQLAADLFDDHEGAIALALKFELGPPLAIAAIKRQYLGTACKAQNIAQIVALVPRARISSCRRQWRIDKEAL